MGSRSGLGLGLGSIVLLAPRMQLPRNFPRPPLQPSTRNQRASAPYILYREGPLRPLCVHLSPSFSVRPTSLGHQAKESSSSFRTLVLIGVAGVCAVLTPFSALGLHAAG